MNPYFFLLVVIIGFIFNIGIQKSIEVSYDDYLNYTNLNNEFAIKYPNDWLIEDTEYTCSDFSFTKNVLALLPDKKENTNIKNKILFIFSSHGCYISYT